MSELTEANDKRRRLPSWPFLGLIGLAVALYLFSRCSSQERSLKPLRPTQTAAEIVTVQGQAVSISFPDLNEQPQALRDRRIRVSGAYTGLSNAGCPAPKGPNLRWSLIADDLQLDAIGFEQVLRLVPPSTRLTVEGVWRLYDGPAGCGKNAAIRSIWYLEVDQILEPNPLLEGRSSPEGQAQEPMPTNTPTDLAPNQPTPTLPETSSLATSTPAATPTVTPRITRTPLPTVTGTPVDRAETPETTVSAATALPSATATLTSSATPGGTSTVQPGATVTNEVATSQPTQTPLATLPPLATATPGGYPGPATTPGSGTATPAGYP